MTLQASNGDRIFAKNIESISQLVSLTCIEFNSVVETSNLPYGLLGPVIVDSGPRKLFYFTDTPISLSMYSVASLRRTIPKLPSLRPNSDFISS